jgi:3'-phosphoadenosine 5'-phosphosulfate sulfotransferase (PAPS reductase)/FAD synthetase
MTDLEYEFILQDRIAKIQAINEQFDLLNNSHISFSGGKDSTVLHYLMDMALPNNKIPRVYANTGIEYNDMVKFVKSMAKKDGRFVILQQDQNIRRTLRENGYPFKSKLHSQKVWRGQNNLKKGKELSDFLKSYISEDTKSIIQKCPRVLVYQFKEILPFNISDKCCLKLKKALLNKFQTKMAITGMRAEEGGAREKLTCLSHNNEKFNPLIVITDEWEEEFIKRNNIQLCKLYYPPYNFERTGCKGCPFSLQLQENLERIYIYAK